MDESLKEWTINYIRHKDAVSQKVVKIDADSKNDFLTVHFKDKVVKHFIIAKLDDKVLNIIKDHEHKVIVALNNEENFNFLIKQWNKFSVTKNLMLIFVNLKINDKWVINPYLHSMVADPDSIENGLRTMFDTANGKVTEVKIAKRKPKIFDDDVADEDDSVNE